MMRQVRPFSVLILALACLPLLTATPYSAVVAYGDSLSDNGNLFAVAGQPGPPYFNGRASNGLLAVENLANRLGVPLHDFAFGGATTGLGNHLDGGTPTNFGIGPLPGMQPLYANSVPTVVAIASGTLFVVWGGPDDYLSPSPLDATPADVTNRAVGDVVGIVNGLIGLGATHILVPGMPDLGLTPYLKGQLFMGVPYSTITDEFNAKLKAALPAGVMFYDTAALMRSVVANPAAYGLTNVTDACYVSPNPVCADPNSYMFFDDFHPTARVNTIVADRFVAVVTPEPSTVVIVAAGVGLLALLRRRVGER